MIVFSAKDAGPAAYLAELILDLKREYLCFASSISSKLFNKFHIENTVVDFESQADYDLFVKNQFDGLRIDLIVTGTSWGNCIDKAFIKFGKENAIKVISIVEHWSWYKERFMSDGVFSLPDFILVNDDQARLAAIKDGLPEKLFLALGNPVLEKKSKLPRINMDKDEWLKNLKLQGKRIITFISEDYSKDFSKNSEYFQGFDEYCVVNDLIDILGEDEHLIIKLHPAENRKKYITCAGMKNVTIIGETDNDKLLLFSDFIVGMGSMLLLEAAVLRGDIISYRPNGHNSFIGNTLGATKLVQDKETLRKIFDGNIKLVNLSFGGRFDGSNERILDFIMGQLN